MEYNNWSRESFDQWIENRRLLVLSVQLPDETLVFQGRILGYNLAEDEITVYNELQNQLTKIKLAHVEHISDDVGPYLDTDHSE
ncbi:MAG TPA: hypothetical protein VJ824_03325 [Bacillota bacterium]|nr:hypothetical protein [Bacillota bacterium]